jgi:peptide/nickel transport system substrate-binding protein
MNEEMDKSKDGTNDAVTTNTQPEVSLDNPKLDKPIVENTPVTKKFPLVLVLIVLLVVGGATALLLNKKDSSVSKTVTKAHQDIAVFKYGSISGDTGTLYPKNSTSPIETSVNAQVYETLVSYQNLTKIVPSLATSWKNPDDSTWVFELQKNVKFHTGKVLTATDVKYSLDEIKKNDDIGGSFAFTIKEVTAVNDNEVKIVTDGPDPLLLNRLTFLYIIDSTAKTSPDANNGTGPYILKPGTTYTATDVKLAAFDGYHGGHVGVRELEYSVYTDEAAAIADLNSGKIDMVNDMSKESLAKINSSVAKPQFIKTNYVDYIRMSYNNATSPIQKLGVRQAIWESLDQKALLATNGLEGEVATQIVPRDIPGYDTSITAPKLDNVKAKKDLANTGYPSGVTIALSYYSPYSDKLAAAIQKQLAVSGITITLDPFKELPAFREKKKAGKTELSLSAFSSDLLDVVDVVAFAGNGLNTNPKVLALVDDANKTLDASKRLEKSKEISRTLMADVAWVPLYTSFINSAITNKNYMLTKDYYGDIGYYFWKGYSQ